ncbi:hypothetical protein ACFV2H_05905 [Streptomyces sp. NPDC059629]|uniref:hypothetical protein n=1 Tax=Streptomyces sp. NPDC059629 TaxID=3346889 RepID=UPI0036BBB609
MVSAKGGRTDVTVWGGTMTQVAAHRGIFESTVGLCDYGDLMNKFLALPFPWMSMYGVE